MLDDRKLEVLKAIVTDYVSSKEPVGSKALVERHRLDVSPATVRNDMAVLEEEGYLIQPHTSAGRIPTDKGYRLFVDKLAEVKPLSGAERRAIASFLEGAADVDDIVGRTVRLLAQLTQQVAIVQYPVASLSTIRHVDLVSLTTNRLLIVLINSTGRVEQAAVEMSDHDQAELSTMAEGINAATFNQTPGTAIDAVSALAQAAAPRVAPIYATLLQMIASEQSTRVVVGGVPNLARFGTEYTASIAPLLEALEEQVVLLRLLGEATSTQPGDVVVSIGHENPYEELRTTSLVASTYGSPVDMWATLGVVGPTRMDYPSNMAAVRSVAKYLGRFLAEG